MTENNLNPKRKPRLTDEQIIAIHKDPRRVTTIAKEYGCSRRTVYDIKNGILGKRLGLGATKKFRELRLERMIAEGKI